MSWRACISRRLVKKVPCRGWGRWIKQCAELERELERSGYQKNRKFFLKSEVELIVRFLGEP